MKFLKIIVFILLPILSQSQVVINEVDADNPGSDNKEFVELKSILPNFLLDGYVLVFYNGQTGVGNLSYYSLDLDGYATDINGIIHFGNSQVSPTPQAPYYPLNSIQNGPDVVALYLGNDSDFPIDTPSSNINLIDAVAYSTSSTFPTSLMNTLGITICSIDNQPLNSTSKSIQRKNDGTYEVKEPTPGTNNDGSGIVLTYLNLSTNLTSYQEEQDLIVTFTSSLPIESNDLIINFSLDNDNFTTDDFTGNTSVTIAVGATSGSTTIHLLNDGINEGDEELKISVSNIPIGFSLYVNNQIFRVNDLNFSVLPFGSPLNPTYGFVSSTAPLGYYDSLEGLSGNTLKQALQDIIANPSIVRAQNYGDAFTILKTSDQNPQNSNQVWLLYTEQPRSKLDMQTGNSIIGKWNREHIYSQSRGGFSDGTSSTPDGINLWLPTNADDILAGHGDVHHIRAVDGQENSSRGNRNYGVDYNGPPENQGSWHGDVARSLFYMAVRYNGLNVVNGNPVDNIIGQIGDLETLLNWNHSDPSDDFEMNRNNYIYNWQMNRNPFIDHPELADYIFGTNFGQPWFSTLSDNDFSELKVYLYPNPAKNYFTISGLLNQGKVEVFNTFGSKVFEQIFYKTENCYIDLPTGLYFVTITSENKQITKKLILK